MRKLIATWMHYIRGRNARTGRQPTVNVRPSHFSLLVHLPKTSLTFVPTIRRSNGS